MKLLTLLWGALVLSPIHSLTSAINIVNRTIDDSFGDSQTGQRVTYLPVVATPWEDEKCGGCAIQPDISHAFMGTYTAATYHPGSPPNMNITMQFTGIAIYVFFILFNNEGGGITTQTEANFTVDGNSPVFFQHIPDMATTDVLFNQLVFHQEDLSNALHTLVISTSGVDISVYVNFDYAIYTHVDTDPPVPSPSIRSPSSISSTASSTATISPRPVNFTNTSSSTSAPLTAAKGTAGSSSNPSPAKSSGTIPFTPIVGSNTGTAKKPTPTGAIVGGITGGLAALITLGTLLMFCFRRHRLHLRKNFPTGYDPPLMAQLKAFLMRVDATAAVDPFPSPPTAQFYIGQYPQQYAPPSKGFQSRYGLGLRTFAESSQGPSSHSREPTRIEATRRARQRELDWRLRAMQEELTLLASNVMDEKSQVRGGLASTLIMDDLRKQLKQMRDKIAFLRRQQQSPWAQGLSDDQPPGYGTWR